MKVILVLLFLALYEGFSSGEYLTKVICEWDGASAISCPAGKVIKIAPDSVLYGRHEPGSVRCPTFWDGNKNCGKFGGSNNVILEEACNNKNTCSVSATTSIYGDPCWGTVKYLQFKYECVRNTEYHTKVICEWDGASTISCPAGQVIKIAPNSVLFGRKVSGSVTCSTILDSNRNCGIFGGNNNVKLEADCNNKNTCSVTATTSIYGDPCWGTSKYLEFIYKCV